MLTIAAVFTVALAIGANTALFAVIYSVLLQPLPFRDPDRLVQIWQTHPTLPQLQVTVPDFEHWRNQTDRFDEIAAHTFSAMNTVTVLGQGEPETVHATMATSNLFSAMAESLLVAGMGGITGVALGACAIYFAQRQLSQFSRIELTAMQGPVLLFALAISAVCSILFGLPACWQVLRRRTRLAGSWGRSVSQARSRLGAVLVASEIAMALVVVTGAALLTRSFAALLSVDPGFRETRILTVADLPLRTGWNQSAGFLSTQLIPRLRQVPGVQAVAAANAAPMGLRRTEQSRFATRFGVEGRTYDSGNFPVAQSRWITPNYFEVLGVPLRRGRWLTEGDRGSARILVNETLAARFFPDENAIGKRLLLGVITANPTANEIVGVVGDVRDLGLDQGAEPTIYTVGAGPVMSLLVRTSADPQLFSASVRDAIRDVDPEIPVMRMQTLEQVTSASLARQRFALTLLAIFGAIAAFLTAVGIYGLLAYSVHARIRELGIRAAVGASSRNLVGMILREAVVLIIPGLAMGTVLSFGFAGVMKGLLYQVSPADPVSIVSAGGILGVLASIAAWLPARRAAAVDPATALRTE